MSNYITISKHYINVYYFYIITDTFRLIQLNSSSTIEEDQLLQQRDYALMRVYHKLITQYPIVRM